MKVKKNKSGNTLIEALIALGILLMGIVPVLTVGIQSVSFYYKSSNSEEGIRISQTIVDYVKSKGYNNLDVLSEGNVGYKFVSDDDGNFIIDKNNGRSFETDFGIEDNEVMISSNGLNLKKVNFYITLDKVTPISKNYNGEDDIFLDPVTGANKSNTYNEEFIFGKLTLYYGDLDPESTQKVKREKELITTFIISPIENRR